MKELAVVRLTRSLVVKVREKVAQKKEKWATEAALSREENKRREAEFKEDFKALKGALTEGTAKAKEELQKNVENASKAKEGLSVKVKEAEERAIASYNEIKQEAEGVSKEEPAKKATPVAEKPKEAAKTTVKKAAAPKSENKTKKEVKKEAPKKSEAKKEAAAKTTKKAAVKTTEKKVAAKKSENKTKKEVKKTASPKTSPKKDAPSKKEAKLALYSADITKHYGKVDEAFLAIVVKNLGPSIYRKDAELVSCSDPKELDTVRKNFLKKKLEMTESDDVLNAAIAEVCQELKASRNKYRATFYYALAKKFKLESKLS